MGRLVVFPVLFASVLIVSCRSYSTTELKVKTGLFNNDYNLLMEAYSKIIINKTTKTQLNDLGFVLTSPNIKHLGGIEAIKLIFGENLFRNTSLSHQELEEFLIELNKYQLVVIPYIDIVENSDQFYLTNKKSTKRGIESRLHFIFKDEIVIYKARSVVEINEEKNDRAFLKGFTDLIEKFPFLKSIK